MIFPWQLSLRLTRYLAMHKLRKTRRFPLVLMLEPLMRCNLACAGCGRIREYSDIMDKMLTTGECLSSVDESGAPLICITGGEPLLHPEIGQIVEGILARGRFLHLSTNGLLLKNSLEKFRPHPCFTFVLHLDGMAGSHDRMAGRKGVFDTTIEAMRAAKQAGFQVRTNTTIYKGTDMKEVRELFNLLAATIPVDGIMVSPAFSYEAVSNDVFLSRQEIVEAFRPVYELRREFRFYNTPLYLEFLAGRRQLQCTPWSNPTRNPKGWKKPCYLITDGHCQSFKELIEETPWEKYGVGNDSRCASCMVHCGFEASALDVLYRDPFAVWRMVKWNFFGG